MKKPAIRKPLVLSKETLLNLTVNSGVRAGQRPASALQTCVTNNVSCGACPTANCP